VNGPTLAIVDDDLDFSMLLANFARRKGFRTQQLYSVAEAGSWLRQNDVDLTLLDMGLPDGTGLDIIECVPRDHRGQIVFVSGTDDPDQIRRAVATPASAFLGKPLREDALERLLAQTRARFESRRRGQRRADGGLLGDSPAMRRVREDIARVAPSRASVLITGETGTGKELVARALHGASGRRGRMISVNCGAVPPDLLASQLFGHERGSFTGAVGRHLGYFEQAAGGTLFLDEIGEMPPMLQVYLLRVLETGRVVRVGGSEEIPVDARIVAATHRSDRGALRDDVYYRIARYPIDLPPLRQRGGDIELLANAVVHRLNRESGDDHKQLDPACVPALMRHPWPGNVRELVAATERAYLHSTGPQVHVAPIHPGTGRHSDGDPDAVQFRVGMTFQEVEEAMLGRTLAFHRGDKTATARTLGVSVRTIHNHVARRRHGG